MEGSPRDLRKSATKRDFLATKPNAWEVKMLRSDLSILIVVFLFALPLIAGGPHHLKIINKDKFHIPTFLLYQLYQLICLLVSWSATICNARNNNKFENVLGKIACA